MDFELTVEQQLVQESTSACMKKIEPLLERIDPAQPMSKELFLKILKEIVPLGALGNIIPEDAGGGGMDCFTWGLMYEKLDKRIDNRINLIAVVANNIFLHGSKEQREKYLPGLLNGELIGCSAITEPNVGSNPAEIETKAVKEGDYYILNGTKLFITNGNTADIAIVLASTDKSKGRNGISAFIVDRRETPFLSRPFELIVGKHYVSELVFEDCRIPKENLLGKEGEGLNATLKELQMGRSIVALHAVKIAQEAIDHSIKYAKERRQFGKPIGKFQLIQSMIAEMIAETEAARLLAYRSLALLDKESKESAAACSMAKYYASEIAVGVTSKAIQIHGAYGLSSENKIEELFRMARINTIPDGTTQIQKLIIGREVLGMSAFV